MAVELIPSEPMRSVASMTAIEELLSIDAGPIAGQTITGAAPKALIREADLDHCALSGVDIQGAVVRSSAFSRCTFDGCNLSNVEWVGTVFTECSFTGCKLVGSDWSRAGLSMLPRPTITFTQCIVDYSSFMGSNLSRARFVDCSLMEADFSDAKLTGAVLQDCKLGSARFHNTDLRQADLRESTGFSLDPRVNRTHGLQISLTETPALLEAFGIAVA